MHCADPAACPGGARTVVAVVDDCGSCKKAGDITLNPTAFKYVNFKHSIDGNIAPNIGITFARSEVAWAAAAAAGLGVAWAPVPCRPLTEGSIHLRVLPGGNSYFQQIALANAAQGVVGVSINTRELRRSGELWQLSGDGAELDLTAPVQVFIVGEDGEEVLAQVAALESQFLGVQL